VSTILLVDDDVVVRKLLGSSLAGAGYRVLSAEDGEAAMRLASHDTEAIDVLVTDVQMPGIHGTELAARLTESRPGLQVILMSATLDSPPDLPPNWRYLRKPFQPSVLLDLLAEVRSRTGRCSPC
jgi:CheY-like chemotaxis protein